MDTSPRQKLLRVINDPRVQAIIYSKFLDYHQWSLRTFVASQASQIGPGQSVLDAGAGELRYKRYFAHCRYTSNDLCVGDEEWYFDDIDVKSTIYEIPVETASFDNILCTQVLEHLEFPELAFKEFRRILKPGGKLILTVPLGQGEHQQPHDFFRYTQFALRSLGDRNDLELVRIEPQGGIFINLEYMLFQALNLLLLQGRSAPVRYALYLLMLPLKFISGMFFTALDALDREKSYTNNYNCVYVRDSPGQAAEPAA